MRKLAPLDVFQKTIEYFPTVSVNILLQNNAGEFLFIKRKTEPAKDYWWVPGGRILNGETIEQAAHLILRQETGLEGDLVFQSPQYFEEIFDVNDFEERDESLYPEEVNKVHYLATAVVIKLKAGDLKLDWTADDVMWSKTIPKNHPYLDAYFKTCGKL